MVVLLLAACPRRPLPLSITRNFSPYRNYHLYLGAKACVLMKDSWFFSTHIVKSLPPSNTENQKEMLRWLIIGALPYFGWILCFFVHYEGNLVYL